jgi:hypothetical protein
MHKFGPKPKFVHIFSSVSITFCKHFYDIEKEHPQIMK